MDNGIIERINVLLVEGFEVEANTIAPEENLKTTLELDSLDYIDLIAITEANFGCKITPEDFEKIITFQDLYDFIAGHATK